MKRILEIGCGQGFNTYVLSKKTNGEVVGIDLSKENILVASKRYPTVMFKKMNAENLHFKNNFFDKVYAIEILEHVNRLDKVLDEIKRVLKPEGTLVVSIPYYKSEEWLLQLRPTYFKEIHHVRIFKENELDSLCNKRHLRVVKKKKKGFLHHIELFFLFKRKTDSRSQLSIGSWRDTIFTKILHATMLYFEPLVCETPLVYFPIWLVTIPAGNVINFFGNMVFPKSLYYEFVKK